MVAKLNQLQSLVLWHSPSHTALDLKRDIANFETLIEVKLKNYCTNLCKLHVHAARLGLRAGCLGAVLGKFCCELSSRNWLKDRAKLVALQPLHSSSLNSLIGEFWGRYWLPFKTTTTAYYLQPQLTSWGTVAKAKIKSVLKEFIFWGNEKTSL